MKEKGKNTYTQGDFSLKTETRYIDTKKMQQY